MVPPPALIIFTGPSLRDICKYLASVPAQPICSWVHVHNVRVSAETVRDATTGGTQEEIEFSSSLYIHF